MLKYTNCLLGQHLTYNAAINYANNNDFNDKLPDWLNFNV